MEISRQHSHFLGLIFVWDWQHFVLIRMLYFLKERTDTMRYSIRCFSIAWPLSSGWSVLILFTAMLRTERCEAAMLPHVREHLSRLLCGKWRESISKCHSAIKNGEIAKICEVYRTEERPRPPSLATLLPIYCYILLPQQNFSTVVQTIPSVLGYRPFILFLILSLFNEL